MPRKKQPESKAEPPEGEMGTRPPYLAGERGIFDPEGVFSTADVAFRLNLSHRKAHELLRDHVESWDGVKGQKLFIGAAFNAAIGKLSGYLPESDEEQDSD